jgi:hypothetical protein
MPERKCHHCHRAILKGDSSYVEMRGHIIWRDFVWEWGTIFLHTKCYIQFLFSIAEEP